MSGSPVTWGDLRTLWSRIRVQGFNAVRRSLLHGSAGRVREVWSDTSVIRGSWLEIPFLQQRWNRLATGDPLVSAPEYVARTYFGGRGKVHILSLGCGTGVRERRWAQALPGSMIEGFDVSPPRIAVAQEAARLAGLEDRMRFCVADVLTLKLPPRSFDLVLVEDALHHFSPVSKVLEIVRGALRPDGYFVVSDFVGPSRFQWTGRQIEAVNELLASIPDRIRTTVQGEVRKRVYRPGWLAMYINDPSEAVESSRIVDLLSQMFRVVEMKPCGGALLHLLFKDIAHHYATPDPEAGQVLRRSCETEDALMQKREIGSDFIFAVCRPAASSGAPG